MPLLQQKRPREEMHSIFIYREMRPTKRVCLLQNDVKLSYQKFINGVSLENNFYS